MAVRALDALRRLPRVRQRLPKPLGRTATVAELAETTVKALLRSGQTPYSVDAAIGDGAFSLADVLCNQVFEDPEEATIRADEVRQAPALLARLVHRERDGLSRHLGVGRDTPRHSRPSKWSIGSASGSARSRAGRSAS